MAKAQSATQSTYTQLSLQQRRLDAGISLEKIAENTKISMRFLRAIEDEEFEKLPGGLYDSSYLRQYAAATGFDEAKLLAHYKRHTEPQRSEEIIVQPRRGGLRHWFRQATAGR